MWGGRGGRGGREGKGGMGGEAEGDELSAAEVEVDEMLVFEFCMTSGGGAFIGVCGGDRRGIGKPGVEVVVLVEAAVAGAICGGFDWTGVRCRSLA